MNVLNAPGCLVLSVWAMLCPFSSQADSATMTRITKLDVPFKVARYEPVAIHKISDYVRPMKPGARRLLRQMNHYFPVIEQLLKEKRLPDFLKYIPVAESRLSTRVVSPQGAAGLWQLMPNTARSYGLEVSSRIDERLDPERATEAALNFLEDLYYEFGDWGLALAAYNCGAGKVKKAMRKTNCREYRDIKLLLPKQTRHYLPSLIAAAYLDTYYRKKKQPAKEETPKIAAQQQSEIFSNFPVNFFKKMPVLVIKAKEKRGIPLVPPSFYVIPAFVQVRPGQRTVEAGDTEYKQV